MTRLLRMRRVKKELLEIDYYDYRVVKESLEIELERENRLKLILYEGYPFKAPRLYVNKENYRNRYKYMYKKHKYLLKRKGIDISCPCCNTILCNWSPSNRIIELLNEYDEKEEIYDRLRTILSIYIVMVQLHDQLQFDKLIVEHITNFI